MKYRQIKKLDIKASVVGQGTGQFGTYAWGYCSQFNNSDINDIISSCIDAGINIFDTSETYGDGRSESLLGMNIKKYSRDDFVLISKVAPWNLRFNNVIKSCELSLKRLQTNSIDIYMIHYPNPLIRLKETVHALELLVKKGKINSIGVSNFSKYFIEKVNELLKKEEVVANEIQYNLFSRRPEQNLIPWCRDQNIDIIAYSPLCGGLLSQKYTVNELPNDRGRAFNFYIKSNFYSSNVKLVNLLHDLSEKYQCSIPQIALNYLFNVGVFSIPASLSVKEVQLNSQSCDLKLSQRDYNLLKLNYHPLSVYHLLFDHGIIRPISWIKEGFRNFWSHK